MQETTDSPAEPKLPPTVWMIEDNEAFRDAVQEALQDKPELYRSQAFEDCESALAAVAKGGKPDVVLLDVGLPGMDGIEGIQHFKKLLPDASLLILTVFENDEKIFRAICAGASGYLLKSESIREILVSLDQAIAGGAPMNPRIARRVLAMFSNMAPAQQDYGLSRRETEVLELMVKGLVRKEIADALQLSTHTVTNFIRCIYRKLHVNCQTAAVLMAVRNKIV